VPTEKITLNIEDVVTAAGALRTCISSAAILWGVPRGGIPAALAVAGAIGCRLTANIAEATHIIDDIYDSGSTAARYNAAYPGMPFLAVFDKRRDPWRGRWLVMPWEVSDAGHDTSAHDAVVRLLQHIGEDPTREGLKDTPDRVIKAWKEWAQGYNQDPAAILKTFEDGATDEMVIVHNVPVISRCEHHLADIIGHAHVGYIPNGRIVGLSKLARLVDVFARRLQVQERLTGQIADALQNHLQPLGVGILVRAAHHCMSTRGVRVHGSVTTTSAMRGALMEKPEARAEFLTLCRLAEGA
jgi:GTP cyclohydrolase I